MAKKEFLRGLQFKKGGFTKTKGLGSWAERAACMATFKIQTTFHS